MGSPDSGGFDEIPEEGQFDDAPADNADKPFDDTPFDAGIEADEESSPEKYIQQLAGKLGQSLRSHSDEIGEPDFDLEKFAINSVLSATNSSKMDQEDQSDIIQKVKSSTTDSKKGDSVDDDNNEPDVDVDVDTDNDGGDDEVDLVNIDMEETHNPNPSRKTVFQNPTLGVKDNGMEENKYLNLESSNKSSIFVDNSKKIKDMVKQHLRLTESPTVLPSTKPTTTPIKEPSRRSKPWTIIPEGIPDPEPKASDLTTISFISNDNISDDSVDITFDVDKVRFVESFVNTGEVLSKPMSYDEPWVYSFETKPLSNGKRYGVGISFYGNPQTNLNLDGFYDGDVPEITEL
jgi:hypothetical protein